MKLDQLTIKLTKILHEIIAREDHIDFLTRRVHQKYKPSAKNLLRYLILRSHDLRKYHGTLSDLGVSSLRSAEGYVYSNLYNVLRNLHLIQGTPFHLDSDIELIGYTKSKKLIRRHANRLFKERQKKHFPEIMVTLPDQAASDKKVIRNMVLNGMEIARINLSHGNVDMWEKMVAYIREIEKETGQKVKIYMDLSGPKIRTASIAILNKKGKKKTGVPVQKGDHLILVKHDPGSKLSHNATGKTKIGVMLGEVVDDARLDDTIFFDDGMIKAVVIDKKEQELEVVITECYKSKLGSHKGINLPNTKINLPALTPKDIGVLPFVCQHADIIGYSFVRTAEDVDVLYTELGKYEAKQVGVVFKIENEEAFTNLPEILIKGMERNKIGVMIARGDLAVELGFERISEVQNEILWICEAAHIPVIWATQVLENLAKTGIPTRAEISDASKAAQAECVMLNKGPYINNAIHVLKNILIRMSGHSFKKKNELRALNVAKSYAKKFKAETALQHSQELQTP